MNKIALEMLKSILTFAPDLSHNLTVNHYRTNAELRPVLIDNDVHIHCKGQYVPLDKISPINRQRLKVKVLELIAA